MVLSALVLWLPYALRPILASELVVLWSGISSLEFVVPSSQTLGLAQFTLVIFALALDVPESTPLLDLTGL